MKLFWISLLALLMIGLVSCVNPITPSGGTKTLGKVVLAPATGLSGRSLESPLAVEASRSLTSAKALGDGSTFSLGDIPSTSAFYFIVQNTGSTPVTNLDFSISAGPKDSSNQYLASVAPGTIGVLDPVGSAGLLQIVKVSVLHGLTSNLLSTAEPSPQGPQQITVHMTYTDSANTSQTSDVTMSYTVQGWSISITATDLVTNNTVVYAPAGYTKLQDAYTGFDARKLSFPVRPGYSVSAASSSPVQVFSNTASVPHDIGVSLSNTGNVPLTLSGTIVYEMQVSTQTPVTLVPFTLILTPGQTLSQTDLASWFNTTVNNATPTQNTDLFPTAKSIWLTIWSSHFNSPSSYFGRISFDVDSGGVVPSIASIYQKNSLGHYSFDLTY